MRLSIVRPTRNGTLWQVQSHEPRVPTRLEKSLHSIVDFLRNSVRGRLALMVLAIGGPAAVLVILLISHGVREERDSVARHLLANTRAIASLVDQQIGRSEVYLEGLAVARSLQTGDLEGFAASARLLASGDQRWIVLSTLDGQQLVNTRLSGGTPLPRMSLSPDLVATVTRGDPFVSDLGFSPLDSGPVIQVSEPVFLAGSPRYILHLMMTPEALAEKLDLARVAPGMVTTILDRSGTIVARHPSGARMVGGQATPDIVAATANRTEGVQESVTLEGLHVLAAFSRASASGWSVAMGAPLAELHASVRRMAMVGGAGSALLLTIAVLMAIWIGRALVRGVEGLVADTLTIGRGGVPVERSSELAETNFVAQTMLTTARRLHERERENEKLTKALQAELVKLRELDQAARRLAAIVQSSSDAILSMDLSGVITSWNESAERIFGYRGQEMIGRSILRLLPPERHGEEDYILEQIRLGVRIADFETVRVRKDGRAVSVSLTVSPLWDQAGNVVGVSKIARDITQRQRAAAQQHSLFELVATVNRAEALPEIYEAALTALCRSQELSRAAVLLLDDAGVMRFRAWRGLSAEFRAALEGHSPWTESNQEPEPLWIDDVAQAHLTPAIREAIENENIQALAFVPLIYQQRLRGQFMLFFDRPGRFAAADFRPAEAMASQVVFAIERRRTAAELETLVQERTASLRQAVAQMEEFSYSVSHDLRAPVRAMRGYSEAMLEDHGARLDEEAKEMLTRILRNSARMDRLIRDLLTYTRISRRELSFEPVAPHKLISEVVQQYPELRPERATIEIAGDLPVVIGHEPSLLQVVSNLLTNAVKFVAPGVHPHVRVSAEIRGDRARLSFQDNGIGIPPEQHSRLFAMFERVHQGIRYEGTGIGLAIVRKAVERMNGSVGVESDGVSGSRFWLELPLATPPKVPRAGGAVAVAGS